MSRPSRRSLLAALGCALLIVGAGAAFAFLQGLGALGEERDATAQEAKALTGLPLDAARDVRATLHQVVTTRTLHLRLTVPGQSLPAFFEKADPVPCAAPKGEAPSWWTPQPVAGWRCASRGGLLLLAGPAAPDAVVYARWESF